MRLGIEADCNLKVCSWWMGGEVWDESEGVFCLDSATLAMRDR